MSKLLDSLRSFGRWVRSLFTSIGDKLRIVGALTIQSLGNALNKWDPLVITGACSTMAVASLAILLTAGIGIFDSIISSIMIGYSTMLIIYFVTWIYELIRLGWKATEGTVEVRFRDTYVIPRGQRVGFYV